MTPASSPSRGGHHGALEPLGGGREARVQGGRGRSSEPPPSTTRSGSSTATTVSMASRQAPAQRRRTAAATRVVRPAVEERLRGRGRRQPGLADEAVQGRARREHLGAAAPAALAGRPARVEREVAQLTGIAAPSQDAATHRDRAADARPDREQHDVGPRSRRQAPAPRAGPCEHRCRGRRADRPLPRSALPGAAPPAPRTRRRGSSCRGGRVDQGRRPPIASTSSSSRLRADVQDELRRHPG